MKCARCGEDIEKGHEYQGKVFGSSCIKIVTPATIKTPISRSIVKADSFNVNILENGRTRIVAKINGRKFFDFIYLPNEHQWPRTIFIENNNAFIMM